MFGDPSPGQLGLSRLHDSVTDEKGLFDLTGGEEGLYDVTFVLGNQNASAMRLYNVTPGPEPLLVTVPETKIPSARFSGRVLDPEGRPLGKLDFDMRRQGEDGTVQYASGVERIEDGGFVSKLIPPGTYALEICTEDLGSLYLGVWEVSPSGTTDIGVQRYPEPGSLHVEMVGPNGERIDRGSLLIRREEQPQGYGISTEHGVGRIEKVHPGRYVVSSGGYWVAGISRVVEVQSGRETKVRFEVPAGIPVKLRYPPIPKDNYVLDIVWRDGSGALVFESRGGFWDQSEEAQVLTQLMPPGAYTLELSDSSGATETIQVVVPARPDERSYDLPLPSR